MKMSEAMEIIENESKGFMVSFKRRCGAMLISGYFPERFEGETLIPTEEEAWDLAERFSEKAGERFVNIYVVDSNFIPVPNYKTRMLHKHLGVEP
jgi:hypothetical protein